jgi:hypothetical protein
MRRLSDWLADMARFCVRLPPKGIGDLKIWRHRHIATALPFPRIRWSDQQSDEERLEKLYDYAVQMANGVIDWYIRRRFWKKTFSRVFRFLSFLFVALAALVSLLKIFSSDIELRILKFFVPLFVSDGLVSEHSGIAVEAALVLIGAAAGFNLIDRLAGLSTGWMRYVTTAMRLNEELVEFQFEWNRLERESRPQATEPTPSGGGSAQPPSAAGQTPTASEQVVVELRRYGKQHNWTVEVMPGTRSEPTMRQIELVQEFCSSIFTIVNGETSDWADELKDNVAHFTKQVVSHHGQDAGKS